MAPRLTPQERQLRQVPEKGPDGLMARYADAAKLMGWKIMHISDSRQMVRRGGRYVIVGDPECKGWPDLFLCHRRTGRALAVEVKRETEDPSDAQAEWLDTLSLCGIDTFVLRPSNWDEAVDLLRRRPALVA